MLSFHVKEPEICVSHRVTGGAGGRHEIQEIQAVYIHYIQQKLINETLLSMSVYSCFQFCVKAPLSRRIRSLIDFF